MKCPYCKNEDPSMIELIRKLFHVTPTVYQYLCNSCSKTWFSEDKVDAIPSRKEN